jgi:arsenate reductase
VKATVYYNPKCGTCRKVSELLEQKGYELTLVEYLKTPPSFDDLEEVCKKLNLEPKDIAREKETVFAEVSARCRSRKQWLQALHDHPILIQRPLVVLGSRAIISRPPETLKKFL